MIASFNDSSAASRRRFRELLGSVPPGMTPDEALELRMALMRDAESKAGRGIRAAVWLGAVIVDLLAWSLVLTPGA